MLIPQFSTDCGLNIEMGRNVFINKWLPLHGTWAASRTDAVIAAGAVVSRSVLAGTMAVCLPTHVIKKLQGAQNNHSSQETRKL